MANLSQMPEGFNHEQAQQMQAIMQMAANGMMPPPNPANYGGQGFPGMPGMDPAMQAAYVSMLQYFQQVQQQGMVGGNMGMPPVPFPGITPYSPPMSMEPTVSVSVEGMKFQYQLTEDDIHKVFRRYGAVKHVSVDEACSSALVTFHNAQDAQAAITDLDGKQLHGLDGTLRINWVNQNPSPPYPGMPFPTPGLLPSTSTAWPGSVPVLPSSTPGTTSIVGQPADDKQGHMKGARKYTCRFLIGIENDKDFQVARRLIGSKGANMKRIVKQTEAKLRLRGVGSGYFEGAGQKESSEPLQLCVSCTSCEGYRTAVHQVEELLGRVYEEFRQFCRDGGRPVPDLQIKLSENHLVYSSRMGASTPSGSGGMPGPAVSEGSGGRPSSGASPKKEGRKRAGAKRNSAKAVSEGDRGEPGPNAPPVAEIEGLINERNEARRSNNFAEADRIRELLQSRGVALMDEPGGRGKGAEVTTWRYWRE